MIQTPVYTHDEARTRETFLALMWAMSYPGRAYPLPAGGHDAFHAVGETLLDLDTSYFTPDFDLAAAFGRLGARSLPPERAQYHFYPELTRDDVGTLTQASAGSMLYPERSATVIVGCSFGEGQMFSMSGPGVNGASLLHVSLSDTFWELRRKITRYPLGWDAFLISDDQVIGLPRTTLLEMV